MNPSKIFTDIVNDSANVEFVNQLNLIRKTAASNAIINTVLNNGVYTAAKPTALQSMTSWIKANPWKSGMIGGAALGAGGVAANTVGKRIGQETADGIADDPVVKALSNPTKMNTAQKINTGIGAAAGLAGGAGLYALLGNVPGIKRKPLLKAILATLGGGAIGYGAWRAADNYQKA